MLPLLVGTALSVAAVLSPSQAPSAPPQPQRVLTIDLGKLKSEPWRLAWSPDGRQLYFEAADVDARGAVKARRGVLVTLADKSIRNLDEPPRWVAEYWTWKAAQASPAVPAFKIAVEQRRETVRAAAAPTGGALARGGSADPNAGTALGDAAHAADTSQVQNIVALKVQGSPTAAAVLIGEWVNQAVAPGLNFGWAPAPRRLIAYARRGGGPLVLLDDEGRNQQLPDSHAAVLPAFSGDGSTIAWLERRDKKRYELMIASVPLP